MARVQKTLEERLAEAQAKRDQLDRQMKLLEDKRKTIDLRRRAKAEKVLLRALLEQAAARPDFSDALGEMVAKSVLKPDDLELALWLLGQPTNINRTLPSAAVG